MASAIIITLPTATKIARKIDLSISTALKQWRGIPQSNRYAVKQWRGLSQWSSNKYRPIHHYKINKNRFSTNTNTCHDVPPEIGFTVDLADLLSTPERDFLIRSNNGEKVPISSLKDKLVGLYFCVNIQDPPRLQTIKKVYEEAKSRGYDFEIVQITLHYHRLNPKGSGTECYEDISWLTVPSMDTGCRKIQQLVFECIDNEYEHWDGDCLVLIHPRQEEADDNSGVLFEFEGAEIIERWGIEGYPFTRQSLYKAQYEVQKREVRLQSLFPPGECLLRRPLSVGGGFDYVDAFSHLSGKRVLVWIAPHQDCADNDYFLPVLKSVYEAQVEENAAEESKFEVVYFPSHCFGKSSFDEFTKDMPWLVRAFSGTNKSFMYEVFKMNEWNPAAVAFNEQGELIAKEDHLPEKKEVDRLRFPFIDQDLEKRIPIEVEGILGRSIYYKENHDLSTAVKQWRESDVSTAVKQCRLKGLPFSKKDCYDLRDIGYTVDVADLLFTPERDFLVKNNGQKIKIDDLRGKTIVLFIVPLDLHHQRDVREGLLSVRYDTRPGEGDDVDMIDAYSELLRMGSAVEFVFVPVQLYCDESVDERFVSQEALFDHLFSTMPFPAIPFSDVQGREGPVVQTFSVDDLDYHYDYDDYDDGCNKISKLPYWVVIDPTNTVVATRYFHPRLFKLFGGAELHPLSRQRISALEASYGSESIAQRISKWDQLLASNTRDFLLSSNGDKVPISSLKGKLIGLYFCENIPQDEYILKTPRMQAIKKVYEDAKSRGYDFEIVQITFHYHPFNAKRLDTDPTVQHCCEHVSWLTLPFKDPSCRKIQRIFQWVDEEDQQWLGDGLVLIHPCQAEAEDDDSSGVLFELAGAYILKRWGIEGYPFTRQSLYEAEYNIQKREVRLQLLFPPGEFLLRSAGDGFNLVDASQLSGKRVLVLFAPHYHVNDNNFVSMLKSEYKAQVEDINVAEESKFEEVYVSTACAYYESSFDEVTKDMPWLVRPFSGEARQCFTFVKAYEWYASEAAAVAFNEQGELIAKEDELREKKEGDKLRFPFIDQDLEKRIRREVEAVRGKGYPPETGGCS